MATAPAATSASDRLFELAGRLERQEGFAEVVASLIAGHAATLDGVWGSSCALAAAALAAHAPGPLVIVCPRAEEVDGLIEDLGLFGRFHAEEFPACEALSGERAVQDEAAGDRLRLLKTLQSPARPPLVVAGVEALLQPVPEREALARQTRSLRVGEQISLEDLAGWLARNRFHPTTAVELPGEFSIRGGIVDVFALDWLEPVRVEFFGDEIESIRRFEPSRQRSLDSLDSVDVTVLEASPPARGHFADFLPPESWFLLLEPGELEEQGRHYRQRMERPDDLHAVADVLRRIYQFPSVTASSVAAGSLETTCRLKIESVERFSGDINKVRDELDDAGAGQEVFWSAKPRPRCAASARSSPRRALHSTDACTSPWARCKAVFASCRRALCCSAAASCFGGATCRVRRGGGWARAIDSFLDLHEGDLVVHVGHGIARYRGLTLLEKNGQVEEHLELEFRGRTKLYVPASKIGLVQKYIGGSKSRPTLARLGGRSWDRQKGKVRRGGRRPRRRHDRVAGGAGVAAGHQLPRQHRMAARVRRLVSLPGDRRPVGRHGRDPRRHGQIAAHGPPPLRRRRLREDGSGDAGGVQGGRRRLPGGRARADDDPLPSSTSARSRRGWRNIPSRSPSLSRFSTRGEQSRTIERLAEGSIDVVIGTHRLAQPDVSFHNLGLVIIDEEQRFGVEVKERLKAFRRIVDVLTMTATPIPRTLHMSLMGLRDISNLETPPEDRLAVETRVARFQGELIRHAVLRELNRGGRIFFVHNRVEDIGVVAARLWPNRPRSPPPRRPRPNAGARPGASDARFRRSPLRPPPGDDDRRKRLGHPQREHDFHRRGGPLRAGRPAPTPRPRRTLQTPRVLPPAARSEQEPLAQRRETAAGDRGVQRHGRGLRHRHARPGDPRRGKHFGHGAERAHRRRRLRNVLRLLEQAVAQLKSLPLRAAIEVDVDLPGEGFIPLRLRAGHAVEDRPLSAVGAGGDAGGIGGFRRRVAGPLRAAAAGDATHPLAGRTADRRPRVADRDDPFGRPIRGVGLRVGAEDAGACLPKRGGIAGR